MYKNGRIKMEACSMDLMQLEPVSSLYKHFLRQDNHPSVNTYIAQQQEWTKYYVTGTQSE